MVDLWVLFRSSFGRVCSFHFCIAQLKVNLRPLWSPAAEALSSLAKRFGDSVWACLFDELQAVSKADAGCGLPGWLTKDAGQDVNDDPWEEERTWRDGAAHKMRNVISNWLDEHHDRKAIILVSAIFDFGGADSVSVWIGPKAVRSIRSSLVRDPATLDARTVLLRRRKTQPRTCPVLFVDDGQRRPPPTQTHRMAHSL